MENLDWVDGVGTLKGSDLKFEYVDKVLMLIDDSPCISNCRTCGCYGLRSEFYKPNYCVHSCYMSSNENDKFFKNAPIKLFKRPALPINNPFRPGQMLEAIDPENQSLFSVVSVSQVIGYRLKLHFEGFSNQFDFYTNADSIDIFPPGWCEEHVIELQTPPHLDFNWSVYLIQKKSQPAPRSNFQITKETLQKTGVEIGMKLEAVDIRNPNNMIICVATVTQVLGERFLIHFDSWDHIYDYWADLTCPFIFPIGHCAKYNKKITPPNNAKLPFRWDEYLKKNHAVGMPPRLFQPLPPVGFKKGMRIEAVDMRNCELIRPCVIVQTEGHMLTVHYEGMDEMYDTKFTELSGDIHPVGYCEHTGHPIENIPIKKRKDKCQVIGCYGKGHALKTSNSHSNFKHCPYNLNLNSKINERVIIVNDGLKTMVVRSSLERKNDDRDLEDQAEKKMKALAKMIILEKKKTHRRKENFIFENLLADLNVGIVKRWDSNQVFNFIKKIPACSNVAHIFKEQIIDGDSLLLLNKNDLINQKIQTGTAIKIIYIIQIIKNYQ